MDELIGRWHTFAGQSKEDIAAQFNDESLLLFAEIMAKALGYAARGDEKFASADEFAEYVLDLRASERAWSWRLGDVILRAHDQCDDGHIEDAKGTLENFRTTCPWRFFAEIAQAQLENIGGG